MAVLSVLRKMYCDTRRMVSLRNILCAAMKGTNVSVTVPVRNMAHDGYRVMHLTASRVSWRICKDELHLYATIGLVPLLLCVFFVNIFIGPAELAEIPEGYEPKHWEYYKHPIQRFFSRYTCVMPQQSYEKNMHYYNEENERLEWRRVTRIAHELMAERDDYKAWYFIPSDDTGRRLRTVRKGVDDSDKSFGYN